MSTENTEKQQTQSQTELPLVEVIERRRATLFQPDFAAYKKANAYPGAEYFFVGHSYDVELPKGNDKTNPDVAKRVDAIKTVLGETKECISVGTALGNENFNTVLTRFEHDFLTRLPASALIGLAIDKEGKVIEPSFSVWREERRKARQTEAT
ncbi:MAG TPA: hypothetical protein V6C81_19010 [Planktothrix sp.]|jgi:hypothetical protein